MTDQPSKIDDLLTGAVATETALTKQLHALRTDINVLREAELSVEVQLEAIRSTIGVYRNFIADIQPEPVYGFAVPRDIPTVEECMAMDVPMVDEADEADEAKRAALAKPFRYDADDRCSSFNHPSHPDTDPDGHS